HPLRHYPSILTIGMPPVNLVPTATPTTAPAAFLDLPPFLRNLLGLAKPTAIPITGATPTP
ncbi:MAG TPA: hypothetical protein VF498_10755, partial [Anaerolineales bacterium]